MDSIDPVVRSLKILDERIQAPLDEVWENVSPNQLKTTSNIGIKAPDDNMDFGTKSFTISSRPGPVEFWVNKLFVCPVCKFTAEHHTAEGGTSCISRAATYFDYFAQLLFGVGCMQLLAFYWEFSNFLNASLTSFIRKGTIKNV